ncbi:hypothetical protein NE172_05330 [Clostridium botulinum]|uniref:Uncharacterized protein n=1 Tax=Clostridium botulinum TaxID=1491 RepID=A0A6B4JJ81_CLOBO|nr:hypothetical protein [Clostridium botulinum]EES49128.1 hypothetical protein CLO_1436 [Clostridium botulinum E1 str. 'BoNT E Beluga']MBY6760583.1 hypothetical protein [Clostridium botulinum]MBY6919490.1 hypothetical protein [Clostridium botulinum]MCR1130369.1 hypothetical protein [Clostridium botulinum]NFJ56877.1 hypothetical protein [Clostridium botulinum]
MYSHKILIDNEGFVVENCVLLKDNVAQNVEVQEGQFLVNYYDKKYIKPKWNFEREEWTEGATEEELKEWEENNKPKPKEPTETEQLQKQLLETQALVAELRYKTIVKENGGM